MSNINKIKVFKIIIAVIVVIILIAVIIYLVPLIKNLTTQEGQLEFKQRVNDTGFLGMLTLFGLQLAQIFLIILPGEPIEILAGMCYGGLWGTIFILISSAIISTGIIFFVRKLGKKFVYDFCGEEKIKKIENSKLFKNSQKIELIMIILFIIPGTPKDLFVYIAGLLPIRPIRFVLISTFARIPSIISSTLAGANLASGDWKMSLIIYAVTFVIVGIIVFCIKKFDKSNTTGETLSAIQKDMK